MLSLNAGFWVVLGAHLSKRCCASVGRCAWSTETCRFAEKLRGYRSLDPAPAAEPLPQHRAETRRPESAVFSANARTGCAASAGERQGASPLQGSCDFVTPDGRLFRPAGLNSARLCAHVATLLSNCTNDCRAVSRFCDERLPAFPAASLGDTPRLGDAVACNRIAEPVGGPASTPQRIRRHRNARFRRDMMDSRASAPLGARERSFPGGAAATACLGSGSWRISYSKIVDEVTHFWGSF